MIHDSCICWQSLRFINGIIYISLWIDSCEVLIVMEMQANVASQAETLAWFSAFKWAIIRGQKLTWTREWCSHHIGSSVIFFTFKFKYAIVRKYWCFPTDCLLNFLAIGRNDENISINIAWPWRQSIGIVCLILLVVVSLEDIASTLWKTRGDVDLADEFLCGMKTSSSCSTVHVSNVSVKYKFHWNFLMMINLVNHTMKMGMVIVKN